MWLRTQPGRLTAAFPLFLHGSADDPLLSAFIQVLLRPPQLTPQHLLPFASFYWCTLHSSKIGFLETT